MGIPFWLLIRSPDNSSHHPVMKNLLLRRWLFFCMPDTWLLWIDDGFLRMVTMLQSLRSGQNVGCKIFWALLLVHISVFIAFLHQKQLPRQDVDTSEHYFDHKKA
ncbi:hypothetical protein ACFX13_047654 [Malus domestica]